MRLSLRFQGQLVAVMNEGRGKPPPYVPLSVNRADHEAALRRIRRVSASMRAEERKNRSLFRRFIEFFEFVDRAGDAKGAAAYAHGYKPHAKLNIGRGHAGKSHEAAQQQDRPSDDGDNVFYLNPSLFDGETLSPKPGNSNADDEDRRPLSDAMADLIAISSGFFLGIGVTLFGLAIVSVSSMGGS